MVNFWEDVTKMLKEEFKRAADSKFSSLGMICLLFQID